MASPNDTLIEVRDFKGLNLFASDANVNLSETRTAIDVLFESDGSITMRAPFRTCVKQEPTKLSAVGEPYGLWALPVTLGPLPAPNKGSPSSTAHVAVVVGGSKGVWIGVVNANTVDESGFNFLWEATAPIAASGPTALSCIAAVGNLYYTAGGVTTRIYFSAAGISTLRLPDPASNPRRRYRVIPFVSPDSEERSRAYATTSQSWSTNYPNPFGDVQYTIADAQYWSDSDTLGRFPTAEVAYSIDLGSAEYVYAASGSVLRWAHPSQWLDSQYWGYAAPTTASDVKNGGTPRRTPTGDPGPDWPAGSSNNTGVGDAQIRLFGPEDWHRDDYTIISQSDGDSISALAHYYDSLVVFKDRGVWLLRGNLPNSLYVNPVSDSVGTPSQKAVAVTPHGIFFYSHPDGLYYWDSSTIHRLSDKLGTAGHLVSGLQPERVSLTYIDELLVMVLPGPSTQRTFVYDIRLGTWSEWTTPATQVTVFPAIGQHTRLLGLTPPASGGDAHSFVFYRPDISSSAEDATGGTTALPDLTKEYAADVRIGPFTNRNAPDMQCLWQRQRYEVANTSALPVTLTALHEYADGYKGHAIDTVEMVADRLGVQSLVTPRGRRSRSFFCTVQWKDRALRLTAVVASFWQGKRD